MNQIQIYLSCYDDSCSVFSLSTACLPHTLELFSSLLESYPARLEAVRETGGRHTKYWTEVIITTEINLDLDHISYTIVVLCLSFLSFAGQGGRKVSGQFLRKSVGQFMTFDPFDRLSNQTGLSKYYNEDAHTWQNSLALKWGIIIGSTPIIDNFIAIFRKHTQKIKQKLVTEMCSTLQHQSCDRK